MLTKRKNSANMLVNHENTRDTQILGI